MTEGDISIVGFIVSFGSDITWQRSHTKAMEQPAAAVVGHKEFFEEKHVKYIKQVAADTKSFGFIVSQHLRMSGIYWGLTSLSVLGIDIIEVMDTASIVDWVMSCQDDTGGYEKVFYYRNGEKSTAHTTTFFQMMIN